MKYAGIVKDGVVVFETPALLSEGTPVFVEEVSAPSKRKMTREEAMRAIESSDLSFGASWDELKKETR